MKKLKGSRTEHNLMAAFAGESQARNRYTFYAGIASKEGHEGVASVFLEEFEVPLGVHLLVIRRLEEDRGDALVSLFGSDPRVEGVPVPRLRLAGERGHQVVLGARPLQLFHVSSNPIGMLKRTIVDNYREMPGGGATKKIDGR